MRWPCWSGRAHYLDYAHQDAEHQPVCSVGVAKPRALATVRPVTLTVRLHGPPLAHPVVMSLHDGACVAYTLPPLVIPGGQRQTSLRLPRGRSVLMATGADLNSEQVAFTLNAALTVNLDPTKPVP